jgi:hypothetical protein
VLLQDAQHLSGVFGVQVVPPGVDARRHLVGPIAQHAFELGAEEQRVVDQVPVPQAIGGLVQRKPQCGLTLLHLGFQFQPARDVARDGQEVLHTFQREGGGDHFHRHFVTIAVAVPPDKNIRRLRADHRAISVHCGRPRTSFCRLSTE